MKTADFIPLILLELKGGDKYGLEITKSIEKRSNGRIVIKQPTLYTILKKLEKSKFISSYWLDSDIGGKRHYYKITENGKLQASTFPNYNEVIRQILEEEDKSSTQSREVEQLSLLGSLADEPVESVVPSHEVFNSNNIDNLTASDLNQQNTNILHNETLTKENRFASNSDVMKFTKKPETKISTEYKEQLKSIYETTNKKYHDEDVQINNSNYNNIAYVDYVDLKKDSNYLYAKMTAKNMFYRVLSTCIYLLIAIILTSIPVRFTPDASVYYISLIISVLCLIFYPTLLAFNYQGFRLRCEEHPFKFNYKRQLWISFIVVVMVIVLFLLLNLTMLDISFSEIFKGNNFVNFYSPLIISTTMFADVLFAYIFFEKKAKVTTQN